MIPSALCPPQTSSIRVKAKVISMAHKVLHLLSSPPPMLMLYYSLCFGLQQYWIVAIPCTSGHAPASGLSELYFLAGMIPLEDDLLAPSVTSSPYHYPTGYVLYLLISLPTII